MQSMGLLPKRHLKTWMIPPIQTSSNSANQEARPSVLLTMIVLKLIQADTESLEAMITRHRLRVPGHPSQMLDSHLPKQILFSELASCKRPQGAPKDAAKTSPRLHLEEDRNQPCRLREGSCRKKSLEKDSLWKNSSFWEQQKAAWRHLRGKQELITLWTSYMCTISCCGCSQLFCVNIGLISHQRKCR